MVSRTRVGPTVGKMIAIIQIGSGRNVKYLDSKDLVIVASYKFQCALTKCAGDNTDEINSNLLDITSTRLDSLSDDDEIQNNSYPPRYSHFREDTVPLCKSAAVNEASQHAAFLSNVFSTHPSALNPEVRPRITALDMWEVSDDREMRAKIQRGEELESSFQEDMDKYFAIKILRAQGDGSWEIALDELITENRNWATARKVDTSEDGDTNMEEEWVTPSGSPARILQELSMFLAPVF